MEICKLVKVCLKLGFSLHLAYYNIFTSFTTKIQEVLEILRTAVIIRSVFFLFKSVSFVLIAFNLK
jgi:hypothetical protein